MVEQTKAVSTQVFSPEQEAERLRLLGNYHAQDHLAKWNAYDKQAGKNREVVYYPAAWRFYELNLRYPIANFDCDIVHMDAEKDFCIVKARLYLGTDFAVSPKRAVAHKQGKLSELDKVETKAMARCARNFGVGTEHALDMDDLEADAISPEQEANNGHAVRVVDADKPAPAPVVEAAQANGHHDLPTLRELQARCKVLFGAGRWQAVILKALKVEDPDLTIQEDDLTPDDREKIAAYMDFVESTKKASAGTGK